MRHDTNATPHPGATRVLLAFAAFAVLVTSGAGAAAPPVPPPASAPAAGAPSTTAPLTIDRVAFLQGCWEQVSERQTVEEQWTAPRGGMMMSVGRTVRDGRLVDFEFVVLREQDGVL